MKALTITPNFTIMAEVSSEHYMDNLFGILRCFCEVEANVEFIDSYRITPNSIWKGMNTLPELDFIKLLKDNVKSDIPGNVLVDLEKFISRFGLVTLVGDDCLKISDTDVLTEIKHNTRLNEMIYEYDGDLIFFEGDIKYFQEILSNDLFCPIRFRDSKRFTYLLKDGAQHIVVKASNPTQALKSLYGKHKSLGEEQLRTILKYKKNEITEEAVNDFIQVILSSVNEHFNYMIQVPNKTNMEPVKF